MIYTNKDFVEEYGPDIPEYYKKIGLPYEYDNIVPIASGLLKFNEDTACIWGGPYLDKYCEFQISDWTHRTHYVLRSKADLLEYHFDWELKSDYGSLKKYRETHSKANPEARKILKDKWLTEPIGNYHIRETYILQEYPSIELPISFYCTGNDDTSYTARFASSKEALDLLNLLGALDEIDFYEDFLPFGFVFTN